MINKNKTGTVLLGRKLILCSAFTAAVFTAFTGICAYADTVSVYLGGETHEETESSISAAQGGSIYAYKYENTESDGDYAPADGGNVTDERLGDNIIEYDELGTFIHKYNPTIKNLRTNSESTKTQYKTLKAELKSELWDTVKEAADARSDGDSESYSTYKSYESIYKSAIKSYNSAIDRLNSLASTKSIKNAEKSLTNAAQSLMISYNSLKFTYDSTEKLCEYYEVAYNNAKLARSVGNMTESDEAAAEAKLSGARASLNTINGSMDEVYAGLCNILGIDPSAGYTISEIPEPDTEYVKSVNISADRDKAINANQSVQSTKHSSTDGTASMNIKSASEQQESDTAGIGFDTAYSGMKEALSNYEAEKTVLADTEQAWSTAKNKKNMGMLSDADYLYEEVSYLNQKAQYETAKLNLISSIKNYKWLLEGID